MTWWTGNVSIVLLAAISLVIVSYRLWRQRKRRLAAKANVGWTGQDFVDISEP